MYDSIGLELRFDHCRDMTARTTGTGNAPKGGVPQLPKLRKSVDRLGVPVVVAVFVGAFAAANVDPAVGSNAA